MLIFACQKSDGFAFFPCAAGSPGSMNKIGNSERRVIVDHQGNPFNIEATASQVRGY